MAPGHVALYIRLASITGSDARILFAFSHDKNTIKEPGMKRLKPFGGFWRGIRPLPRSLLSDTYHKARWPYLRKAEGRHPHYLRNNNGRGNARSSSRLSLRAWRALSGRYRRVQPADLVSPKLRKRLH